MINKSSRDEIHYGVLMSIRDMVEGFALAFILAFIFRGFVVEAFIIPTGSMAHGLQGRHIEHICKRCGHRYRVGASVENPNPADPYSNDEIIATVCPMCGFTEVLDKANEPSKNAFAGDRILVNKYAYMFNDPERWDVIVFKNPSDTTINYIKRLVGLPGEKLLVANGDVYTKPLTNTNAVYEIARKPEHKQLAMMQLVHDTQFRPQVLDDIMWPQPWRMVGTYADGYHPPAEEGKPGYWKASTEGFRYSIDGSNSDKVSIRYHHNIPDQTFWVKYNQLEANIKQAEAEGYIAEAAQSRERLKKMFWPLPKLITDVYAYNTSIKRSDLLSPTKNPFRRFPNEVVEQGSESDSTRGDSDSVDLGSEYVARFRDVLEGDYPAPNQVVNSVSQMLKSDWPSGDMRGQYWVGDLAVEFDVTIESDSGKLGFDIVESGVYYEGEIDVATGKLTLSIDGGEEYFVSSNSDNSAGFKGPVIEGQTSIRGKGDYEIRFSNFDNELRVWVDDDLIELNHPATFETERIRGPRWSAEDAGDLLPVGLHSTGVAVELTDARIYRDVYYIATKSIGRNREYSLNDFRESEETMKLISQYEDDIARIEPIWLLPRSSKLPSYSELSLHLDLFPAWNDSKFLIDRQALEFEVEEDEFFPMGDNSPQSSDARSSSWFNQVGRHTFNRKLFIGEALLIYWPHPDEIPGSGVSLIPNFRRIGVIR